MAASGRRPFYFRVRSAFTDRLPRAVRRDDGLTAVSTTCSIPSRKAHSSVHTLVGGAAWRTRPARELRPRRERRSGRPPAWSRSGRSCQLWLLALRWPPAALHYRLHQVETWTLPCLPNQYIPIEAWRLHLPAIWASDHLWTSGPPGCRTRRLLVVTQALSR